MAERKSLYERLLGDLENNSKVKQELSSGRRIGFYRLKTQLGAGNFAQVRLGLHLLTNGELHLRSPVSRLVLVSCDALPLSMASPREGSCEDNGQDSAG